MFLKNFSKEMSENEEKIIPHIFEIDSEFNFDQHYC